MVLVSLQCFNEAAKGAIVGVIAAITLVFVLITAALGLGLLFNSSFYGFLAVTGILVILLIISAAIKPRIVKVKFSQPETEDTKKLKQKSGPSN